VWGEGNIVRGKPRHSQSQGSGERTNQDAENILSTWLENNKIYRSSEGLVQLMKNRSYHVVIKCSP
jgi:hypothetical protein